MLCPIGSGKMAVMARLLAAASVSQKIAEEVGQQKLAAQYIYRELREADEANLLDEEDMHVFGLMPMTDPLHLVCCNACEKPVKVSQYAAHAELCRLLNSAEEMKSVRDGGLGHRKPPRKERKKLLTAYINQATFVGQREGSESLDTDDANASAQLDGQPGIPSFSMDAKRNSVCVDVASILDGKGVSPENTFHSACIMPPPGKRSKPTSNQHQSLSDDPSTASGLTKSTTTQDIYACGDFQIQSTSGTGMPKYCIGSDYRQEMHEHCLLKDTPVPLAAKIYYSQRDNRLRSAIAHLYHVTSVKGLCSSVGSPKLSQDGLMLQALSQRDTSHGQADDLLNKKREHSPHKPGQSLAQSSELCLDKSGGHVPVKNFSNQFPADKILRPQTAPVGFPRSKYIPQPYSFDNDSGKSHGTVQQANGRVPVL